MEKIGKVWVESEMWNWVWGEKSNRDKRREPLDIEGLRVQAFGTSGDDGNWQ